MISKDQFVEYLKKMGYSGATVEGGMVTINLVGATKEEVKKTFLDVKLLANKIGYKHSYRVVKLEESHE